MQTSSSSPASPTSLHLGTAIVAALNQRGPTSVPFLGRILGRRASELEEYLQPLQEQGVIERDQDKVWLAPDANRRG